MIERKGFVTDLVGSSKYRPILISLLALIVALTAVLFANYQFAKRATVATEHMDLIGDVSDRTLFIAIDAQRLATVAQIGSKEEVGDVLQQLKAEADAINELMTQIGRYEQKETAMTEFGQFWTQYNKKIQALDINTPNQAYIDLANYAYAQQDPIFDYMDEGYNAYLEESLQMADYSRYAQIATFVGLLLFLLVFVGYALQRMRSGDKLIEKAQQETSDIMKTVNEGLFLIDRSLNIGHQYSNKLELIIGQDRLAGRNLYDLLQGMISQKDMDTTKLFIEQLYNPWVIEDLIQDLNPLKQIKINYFDSNGAAKQKYLDFNFLRVNSSGDSDDESVIDKVFVSVVDITEEMLLQQGLESAKAQHERELDMIGNILAVDNQYLLAFINNTSQRIEKMNNILKLGNVNHISLHAKAQELLREMHSLKGEASALKLEAFVGIAEEQETKLKQLLENSQLSGDDFLGFTVGLDKLFELNLYVNKLLNRLRILGENVNKNDEAGDNTLAWQTYFKNYAADIAARHNKKVVVNVQGFDEVAMHKNFNIYKDIAVQLLKNAIVHGIETPNERIAKGKKETGIVNLKIKIEGANLKLGIEDDGQGINFNGIRQKAVELGYVSATEAETLTNKQLYTIMIRKSGLSTATSQSEDAGRGVGMSLIYNLVQSAEGKLEIDSRTGKYTRMAVGFPLV